MQRWRKKGEIFNCSHDWPWSQSHAQVPTVDVIDDKVWRIFYATRSAENQSNTSYIDVEAGNPSRILYVHDQPIFEFGPPGTFDDSGIMPSWVTTHNGMKYMYYIGWTTRTTVPYHNSIGLAVSEDGKEYRKYGEGPLFGPTLTEPYFTGTSCVLIDSGIWKNWYLSCTGWRRIGDKLEPWYHLKYAESTDGVEWQRDGRIAVDFKDEKEGGIAKASVIHESGRYRMWFSTRGGSGYRTDSGAAYRIGYAESADGKDWIRNDEDAGIDVSSEGWDSMMVCYPHVVEHDGRLFMFYNGNGFGQTGFGYAVLEH